MTEPKEPESLILAQFRELRQKLESVEARLEGKIDQLRSGMGHETATIRAEMGEFAKAVQTGFTNLQATVATRADVDALREEVRKLGVESATHSSQIGRVHAAVMGFNDRLAKVERT